MTITDKADFKAKVRASMCQLQNDPEKIRTKNYRSNMPPDSAFTYGLIYLWNFQFDTGLVGIKVWPRQVRNEGWRRILSAWWLGDKGGSSVY